MNSQEFRHIYPNESDDVIMLAWILQSMDKAKDFILRLKACIDYDGLVRIVYDMYQDCETLDQKRATSEKRFIVYLLPFLDSFNTKPNAHTAATHIRPVINNANKVHHYVSLKKADNLDDYADANGMIHYRIMSEGYAHINDLKSFMSKSKNVNITISPIMPSNEHRRRPFARFSIDDGIDTIQMGISSALKPNPARIPKYKKKRQVLARCVNHPSVCIEICGEVKAATRALRQIMRKMAARRMSKGIYSANLSVCRRLNRKSEKELFFFSQPNGDGSGLSYIEILDFDKRSSRNRK